MSLELVAVASERRQGTRISAVAEVPIPGTGGIDCYKRADSCLVGAVPDDGLGDR